MKTYRVTAEQLRERVEYDTVTGVFKRRAATGRHGCHKAGAILGTVSSSTGYRVINLSSVNYAAHRLAWLYVTGEWPNLIDHINGDRLDNRFANLRSVTQTENMQNLRRATRMSKSGLLGASPSSNGDGRWVAHIRIGGEAKYIGTYATAQEAHDVYIAAKREHHPGGTL